MCDRRRHHITSSAIFKISVSLVDFTFPCFHHYRYIIIIINNNSKKKTSSYPFNNMHE
jgi:hypothetical protein